MPADIPGVIAKGLTIDLRDDTLTLTGEVKPLNRPEEEDILIENQFELIHRHFIYFPISGKWSSAILKYQNSKF